MPCARSTRRTYVQSFAAGFYECVNMQVHRKLTGDGYAKGFDVGNSLDVR